MEWAFNRSNSVSLYIIIILVPFITFLLLHLWGKRKRNPTVPPGPKGWPFFGHLFSLGSMPHRNLAALRQKYGAVIMIKLGSKDTLVIQSSRAAAELFKKHDLDFADRSIIETMRSHDYHKGSMVLAPYGSNWRVLKRIVTLEMMVNKRLNESSTIREKCVGEMLSWIDKKADDLNDGQRHGIHVMHYAFLATFNMMGNLLFSQDLVDPQSNELASEMFTTAGDIMVVVGAFNVSDYFPWLTRLDLQRLRRRMDHSMGKAIEICSSYMEDRLEERKEPARGREKRKDFLEVLLDYEGIGLDEPAKLSKHTICTFMLDNIFGGTETTSSVVEWALTELLRRPEAMKKLKAELAKVIGPNKTLRERYIDSLPYLQAVVKETLRLHPPVQFLVPRRAIPENTNFMGYNIPRNTQVFVNAWAIGRDPECWDEPSSFKPERFLSSDGSFKSKDGQHFEMIPFGGGRRACPGIPLALRTVPLILGSMIHEFEWELENNMSGETIDMREKMGSAMTKLEPLIAVPKRIV